MPRPGPRVHEKSKDFFGSMKRLLKNLKTWKFLIGVSLVLAMVSSVLALIAPNKLSLFADEIGKGLVPKTENFEVISAKILENLNEEKMISKMYVISTSTLISNEDKSTFNGIMNSLQTADDETKSKLFLTIPESILSILFEPVVVNDVEISVEDQISMINIMKNIGTETSTSNALNQIDMLPKSVYSLIEPEMNTSKIKDIVIFMGILYICSAIFSFIQSFSMTTISNKFAKKLRSSVSSKINRLPLNYFDTHEAGDVLSRVTNDIDTIAQNLNNSLSSLVSSITLFLGSIIMMFYTNGIMAITAILSSFIGFMFMFSILKKSQKYFAENQKALGNLNGFIEEIYSGHNVVKSYNGSLKAIEDFTVLNNKLYEAKRKSIFMSGTMQPLMGFIGNLGYVAVCIVGALLTMNGYISFGVIVAFMIYIRLFTNPLSQIAQAMTNLQSTAAASERVFELLDEKEMPKEDNIKLSISKDKATGDITFKNVEFTYPSNDKPTITNFSAAVKRGEKVAIVGPTGAGKTTMVNLLMKFYDINDGEILIDGINTSNLKRHNVHELFCMVLQDTWLFDGTVRDNIKFNKENVTDEEIWNALKVVGIDHFVKTLPGGQDARINDSDTVSSGQKQLFTIARGMLLDAPFLILDEATSNVDTRTEELVQKAMDKLMSGRTSFIIAHRLSTIKNADLILVMKDGNIIESGNHDELMSKNGFYADLYNSQFEL